MSACTFTNANRIDRVLVETPRGAVFLQHAEDGWFRTAHPFDLSPELLTTVFRGVFVQPSSTDTVLDNRVFSDDDTEFLSPLISRAFAKATKHQVVGFRVAHHLAGRQETTEGVLYIQGRLLHLTLTHFRARPNSPELGNTSQGLNPNPTGLDKHHVIFRPEAARRSSRNEQPDVIPSASLASVVLDYEALLEHAALLPAVNRPRPLRPENPSMIRQVIEPIFQADDAAVFRETQAMPSDASQDVQIPATGKARELEGLKEEIRRLQRRLSELEEKTQNTKQPEPPFKQ